MAAIMELFCLKDGGKCFNDTIISHIVREDNALVQFIVENSKDTLKVTDCLGSTLLHQSVLYRNLDLTDYLLRKGAKVNIQDRLGQTPLMIAVSKKDYRIIALLCENGADVTLVDRENKNVLQTAITTKKMPRSIIQALIIHLYNSCLQESEETAKKLFEYNVPLYHVVLLKEADVTRIFLEKYNDDINVRNPETGERAVHVAVQKRDLANVKVLVEHGANVNVRDKEDRTPLFIYGVTSHYPDQKLEVLKVLMDAGAEYKANHWYSGTWQCFPLLSEGNREVVQLFLQYNIDLHARDQFDQTPLHYLACNGNPNILEELEGKDFDVGVRDDEGYTPLHKAIGNPTSVEYLLKKGADVNAVTVEDGETALFKAFVRGYNQVYAKSIEILLQHNAEVQNRTADGDSIFDLAVRKKKFTYSRLRFRTYVESVLAQLALTEDCGRTTITPYTRRRFKSHKVLGKRFKYYKRQLERMKSNKLHDIVTFYELLTASEDEIAKYARNKQLVLSLIRINKKCKKKNYYINTLRKRLTEAIQKERSKERAAVIVSRIIGISYRGNYLIANTTVNYLGDKDIQKLNEAFC